MKSILLLISLFPVVEIHAATIAYWQFDGGTPAATAGSLVTEANAPTLNGSAVAANGGSAPKYDALLPGSMITSGVGGTVVNADNNSSLKFTNGGLPGSTTSNTGGKVTVTDPGGAGSILKPASFTIEGFVRINSVIQFPSLFSKNRADAGGSSWMMDMDGTGKIRARFDTQTLGLGSGNPGFNQGFTTSTSIDDNLWHHVAMTYDSTDRSVDIYVDYLRVGGGTATNALVYDNSIFSIGQGGGGRAFDGFIDDVRLSDQVLTDSEFLRAVPEPSSSFLIFSSYALLVFQRKRKNQR